MINDEEIIQKAHEINNTLTAIVKKITEIMLEEIVPDELDLEIKWVEYPFSLTMKPGKKKEMK